MTSKELSMDACNSIIHNRLSLYWDNMNSCQLASKYANEHSHAPGILPRNKEETIDVILSE